VDLNLTTLVQPPLSHPASRRQTPSCTHPGWCSGTTTYSTT